MSEGTDDPSLCVGCGGDLSVVSGGKWATLGEKPTGAGRVCRDCGSVEKEVLEEGGDRQEGKEK